MTDDLLDFGKKRKENIENKRRMFERLLFKNLLGSYAVLDDGSDCILPIVLIDISRSGCLFQLPSHVKENQKINNGEERILRMYFTKNSYLPAVIQIKYSQCIKDELGHSFMQYGCRFDKEVASFKALKSFIDFLYNFAKFSTHDHGDVKVFYL